jgi:hypothetical protein
MARQPVIFTDFGARGRAERRARAGVAVHGHAFPFLGGNETAAPRLELLPSMPENQKSHFSRRLALARTPTLVNLKDLIAPAPANGDTSNE